MNRLVLSLLCAMSLLVCACSGGGDKSGVTTETKNSPSEKQVEVVFEGVVIPSVETIMDHFCPGIHETYKKVIDLPNDQERRIGGGILHGHVREIFAGKPFYNFKGKLKKEDILYSVVAESNGYSLVMYIGGKELISSVTTENFAEGDDVFVSGTFEDANYGGKKKVIMAVFLPFDGHDGAKSYPVKVYLGKRPDPAGIKIAQDIKNGVSSQNSLQQKTTSSEGEKSIETFATTSTTPNMVSASSTVPPSSKSNYNPKNLTDGDMNTSWCGKGNKGNWVEFAFAGNVKIDKISVIPGYSGNQNTFLRNNRVKTATLTLSNGKTIPAKFSDKMEYQDVAIGAETQTLRLTIDDVYKGQKDDDVCIGEVLFK